MGPALRHDCLQTVISHAEPATAAVAENDEKDEDKQPKLCPDPGLDYPGSVSTSPRAQACQEQISAMINPRRPLPFGLAMNLNAAHIDGARRIQEAVRPLNATLPSLV